MKELRIPAGRWWTMDGEQPEEELVIVPYGPPLQAAQRGFQVITGWRHRPDQETPDWVTVRVRADAGGWSSGPMWSPT